MGRKDAEQEEHLVGGHESILVIDDEDAIRDICGNILQEYGYKTRLAASGEEGLEVFKVHAREIDLVLLDVSMPGMERSCLSQGIGPYISIGAGYRGQRLFAQGPAGGSFDSRCERLYH